MSNAEASEEFLKPDQKAFLFYGFACSFLLSTILFIALFTGYHFLINLLNKGYSPAQSFGVSVRYLWPLLSVVALFTYISKRIKYKKEKYFFLSGKLVHKGGGIFSDFERELSVKNITHVTMMLPFIQNKLFGTGYIRIESAGALTSEIFLRAVSKPKELYEKVINIMKSNGFKLTREKLVEQERPHPLAVFFEVFGIFVGAVLSIAYVSFYIIDEYKIDMHKLVSEHSSLLIGGLGLIIIGVLAYCSLHFLDLKKRLYDLYEDTIAYTEGFLNKNFSFIPIENLSDSSITQSIPSRIFGLYDVKISCQGSGQEILFKNMENGELLSKNIDELISKTQSLTKDEPKVFAPDSSKNVEVSKPITQKIEPDRTYEDRFKMQALRTWMPAIILSPLLIIIFPAAIVSAISNIIAIKCNVFRIKADTIEHTFSFLSKKIKEFSLDKVTGVVFKESFIDKWCKTFSILFWSIGSGENVRFLNISKEEGLREKILAKKGIRKEDVIYALNSKYSAGNMIKGNLYLNLIIALVLTLGFLFLPSYSLLLSFTVLLVYGLGFTYRTIYYKRSKIVFYENYIHFKRGLFFVDDFFVFYDDIKDISTTKFPCSNTGNLQFNVAGELVVKTRNGESITSNSFTIRFVKDISTLDELIDTIFHRRPSAEEISGITDDLVDTSLKPEHTTKPCLSNYLLFVLPCLLIADVAAIASLHLCYYTNLSFAYQALAVVNIAIIIMVVAVIKAISYNMQSYRLYERSGIIFKKQTSIIFTKMDFINFTQGPVNKIFRNGNITVNTTGSSKPELTIKNIMDFKKFYEILKSKYE